MNLLERANADLAQIDLTARMLDEAISAQPSPLSEVSSKPVATATVATSATVWPAPLPIERHAARAPYPMDALPAGIGAAVREYQSYGQQPVALVASSALAVVSLATQGLADIARDEQLAGPLSLNFLVVAQSGERKTAADRALGQVLSDWERERSDALQDNIKESRSAVDAWLAEQEGLKAALKTSIRKKPQEAERLRAELAAHGLRRPAEIYAPRLRYEDVNPQSLAFLLATGHPSAALWSDEGGMVTGSLGMAKESLLGFLSSLNRLWDGGAIRQDRKQAQSVHLEGRRLTVSLMLQPIVLAELFARGGGLTRGSGLLARYLLTAPDSTMGTRFYQAPPRGMPALTEFHRRVRLLLDSTLPMDGQGRLAPPQLRMSENAFALWRAYHDEIERELRPLGEFANARDFAAKSAENAARIAGCLHLFQGIQGAVQARTMDQASRLAHWYLREALCVLNVLDEPQAWGDAQLLDHWLQKTSNAFTRDVLRSGPNPLRDKHRRDAAIEVLVELGRIRIGREGKSERILRNLAL